MSSHQDSRVWTGVLVREAAAQTSKHQATRANNQTTSLPLSSAAAKKAPRTCLPRCALSGPSVFRIVHSKHQVGSSREGESRSFTAPSRRHVFASASPAPTVNPSTRQSTLSTLFISAHAAQCARLTVPFESWCHQFMSNATNCHCRRDVPCRGTTTLFWDKLAIPFQKVPTAFQGRTVGGVGGAALAFLGRGNEVFQAAKGAKARYVTFGIGCCPK
ncbi:hypothetical protein CABS01_09968 [Colletotrichum abscissum]|uniref:uncharacterized protein n=1 Tax=Colletotrichum abscissum TaxID=1671311 RepID=UPI0027D765B1|nr:uncharacterized protein CABS01_09968 [Colletotrichum abscissum]KAK1500244.1 hypothetical protein CABS01_09968 [Colletotrichum abscissum]